MGMGSRPSGNPKDTFINESLEAVNITLYGKSVNITWSGIKWD